jgi:hypothetical protein
MKTTDPAERFVIKILLNSIYGKFGCGNEFVHALPEDEYVKRLDDDPEFHPEAKFAFGFAFWQEPGKFPEYARPHWAAIITARVRRYLRELLSLVRERGGEPLYCDTDSIIYRGPAPEIVFPVRLLGDGLGQLKTEWSREAVYIGGLKLYVVYGEGRKVIKARAKGCPFILTPLERATLSSDDQEALRLDAYARYAMGEKITGRRPGKLRGRGSPNLWSEMERRATLEFKKGRIGSDRKIKPLDMDKEKSHTNYGR